MRDVEDEGERDEHPERRCGLCEQRERTKGQCSPSCTMCFDATLKLHIWKTSRKKPTPKTLKLEVNEKFSFKEIPKHRKIYTFKCEASGCQFCE
mmetsp:Transcript_30695/g.61924  ORF Transcript_30695/g.61924 Transcript_30695/m.61924 type:complete len:94 (-) Transcript_30695:225-506(-)